MAKTPITNHLPKSVIQSMEDIDLDLFAGYCSMWEAIERAEEKIKENYLGITPAPEGVEVYVYESKGRMYARAQANKRIFGGRATHALQREGSVAHKEYLRRIAYRDAKTAVYHLSSELRQMTESLKQVSDLMEVPQ